jgi:hypothetical protein
MSESNLIVSSSADKPRMLNHEQNLFSLSGSELAVDIAISKTQDPRTISKSKGCDLYTCRSSQNSLCFRLCNKNIALDISLAWSHSWIVIKLLPKEDTLFHGVWDTSTYTWIWFEIEVREKDSINQLRAFHFYLQIITFKMTMIWVKINKLTHRLEVMRIEYYTQYDFKMCKEAMKNRTHLSPHS